MNIAVIFAGGSGLRMHTKSKPKQFLDLNGKPIIIYTLELFDDHPLIDAIVVACIEGWIPYLEKQLKKCEINPAERPDKTPFTTDFAPQKPMQRATMPRC